MYVLPIGYLLNMISFSIYIYMFWINIIIRRRWENSDVDTINASYCTWEFKFSVESEITKHCNIHTVMCAYYLHILYLFLEAKIE